MFSVSSALLASYGRPSHSRINITEGDRDGSSYVPQQFSNFLFTNLLTRSYTRTSFNVLSWGYSYDSNSNNFLENSTSKFSRILLVQCSSKSEQLLIQVQYKNSRESLSFEGLLSYSEFSPSLQLLLTMTSYPVDRVTQSKALHRGTPPALTVLQEKIINCRVQL